MRRVGSTLQYTLWKPVNGSRNVELQKYEAEFWACSVYTTRTSVKPLIAVDVAGNMTTNSFEQGLCTAYMT